MRDVEPAGFTGSWSHLSASFRHQSRSIGTKRDFVSVVLTVKS